MKPLYTGLITALIAFALIIPGPACNNDTGKNEEIKVEPLPQDIPGLVEILGREHEPNRNAAMDALVGKGEEAVPALIEALGGNEQARDGAAHTLARIGAPAVQPLIEALSSENGTVRDSAAVALGEIGPDASAAIPSLVAVLGGSGVVYERVHIIHSLGAIGPDNTDVIDAMGKCLTIDDLRADALRVLAEIGPPAAPLKNDMIAILNSTDIRWPIRALAMDALVALGPIEGVPAAIAGSLDEETMEMRQRAADSLGKLGPDAAWTTPQVMELFSDSEAGPRRAAINAVGQMAPDSAQAIPGLINLLSHEDPQTRRDAVNTLKKFGPDASSALDALRNLAANDEFEYVRLAATEAVAAIEENR
jgi:HEAT repeat protein